MPTAILAQHPDLGLLGHQQPQWLTTNKGAHRGNSMFEPGQQPAQHHPLWKWNETRSLQIKFTLHWRLMKITQHDRCKHFSSRREEAGVTALVGTSCLVGTHHLIRPNLNCKINYIQLKTLYREWQRKNTSYKLYSSTGSLLVEEFRGECHHCASLHTPPPQHPGRLLKAEYTMLIPAKQTAQWDLHMHTD